MLISSAPLSADRRHDIARLAFKAARASGIAPGIWRAWRRGDRHRVMLMAFDPLGETERIKKQLSMEVENAAGTE